MKAIYKDKEKNTLIITEEAEQGNASLKTDFREKMVLNNHIKGLMEFSVCIVNHEKRYEYDTGGLINLEYLCIHENLSCDTVKRILTGIRDIMSLGSKYMLDERDYIIDPEYIWMDEGKNPMLVYHTGYGRNFSKQLEQLCEFLMNRLDYHDQKAVVLVYTLYMKSREDGFGSREFTEYLESEKIRTGKTEQPSVALGLVKPDEFSNPYTDVNTLGSFGVYGDTSFFEHDTDRSYPEDYPQNKENTEKKYAKNLFHSGSVIKVALLIVLPALLLLVCLKLKLLTNVSGKVDPLKLGAVLALGAAVGWYIIKKLPASCFENKTHNDKKALPVTEGTNKRKSPVVLNKEDVTELLADSGEETELLFDPNIEKHTPKRVVLVSDSYPSIVADTFPFYIGKDETHMDFCLNATGVSRYHLKLDYIDNTLFMYDLNSKNGSYHNNERIMANRPVKLSKGDHIKIGLCEYRLE